ncbi:hypothetical protein ES703_37519 [subsurface metagenome]
MIREKVEAGVQNKMLTGALYAPFPGLGSLGMAGPKTYKQLFDKKDEGLSNDGFESFEKWFEAVHSGKADERLKTLTEGGDPGYLVPEEFRAQLWDMGLEDSIVRPRATVYPMKRNVLNVPAFDSEDHTAGLYGTVTETWGAEATQKTETDPKFRKMGLNARKLTCFTKSSDELKEDSAIPFGQVIGKAFAGAISFYTDRRYLDGNGAGKPLGVIQAVCTITVAGETGQTTLTIVYENIVNMFSQLAPACWKNAVWVCHNTCLPQLMLLSYPVGTGGSHIPVLKEDSGKLYILGKELLVSEKVPALGTAGCLGLYDFSKYIIGLREDVRIESSINAQFREDITQWRAIVRTDGQPGIATPITLLSGDEVSPFVILDGI